MTCVLAARTATRKQRPRRTLDFASRGRVGCLTTRSGAVREAVADGKGAPAATADNIGAGFATGAAAGGAKVLSRISRARTASALYLSSRRLASSAHGALDHEIGISDQRIASGPDGPLLRSMKLAMESFHFSFHVRFSRD